MSGNLGYKFQSFLQSRHLNFRRTFGGVQEVLYTMTSHVFQGGSKIQEARLIFQDLSDKYPTTCTILNGKALCSTHMGNFEDAEGLLLESLNKVDQLR